MPEFTYYLATCDNCDHPATRIGDAKSPAEILALLVSGDAVSAHSFECLSFFGRGAALAFTLKNETTGEQWKSLR